MKKILLCIVLCLFIVPALSSCKKEMKIEMLDASYSIHGTKEKPADNKWYKKWLSSYTYKDKPKGYIDVQTNIGVIRGKYTNTGIKMFDYYYFDDYEDVDGNSFSVTQQGKLSTYIWYKNNEESEVVLSEEECVKKADEFFCKVANINDYTKTVSYKEEDKIYIVEYYKYVDGIKTYDSAIIKVKLSGQLASYSAFLLGMIPKDLKLNYNMEEIDKKLLKRMEKRYEPTKAYYDYIEYGEREYYLVLLKKNKYCLVCWATAYGVKEKEGYSNRTSDKTLYMIS